MNNIIFPKSSERFVLKVPKDILITELSKEIDFEGKTQIFYDKTDKNFWGQLKGEKFLIKLNTTYRNSFKPTIRLTIRETEEKTEIILKKVGMI